MKTIFIFLALAFAGAHAHAETFCVSDADQLTSALHSAEINAESDEIRLRAGFYAAPADGWHIDLKSGTTGVAVVGGYVDSNCTTQTHDSFNTILDGDATVRPLTIATSMGSGIPAPDSHIRVSTLTIQNGAGGGLKVSDPGPIFGGDIVVENVVFRNNSDGGALQAATDGSGSDGGIYLVVRGCSFVGNRAPDAPAVQLYSNNAIALVNNTFFANQATDATLDKRVLLSYFTFSDLAATNNIFWQNNQDGLPQTFDIAAQQKMHLVHNDIQAIDGTNESEDGDVNVDPSFVDAAAFNVRLRADSPLRDAGIDAPAGGGGSFDLDDTVRIVGTHVDLGAYEFSEMIFHSSFD